MNDQPTVHPQSSVHRSLMLAHLFILLRALDRALNRASVLDLFNLLLFLLVLVLSRIQVRRVLVPSEHLLRIDLLALRCVHQTVVDVVLRVWADVRLEGLFRWRIVFLRFLVGAGFATIEHA